MADHTSQDYYKRQLSRLKTERTSFDGHYKDVAEYLFPKGVQWQDTTPNDGTKSRSAIIDNRAGFALNSAAAGLMAGGSSPARPWMRLATPDPDRNEFGPVKEWLHKNTQILLYLMAKSNGYEALHAGYKSRLAFGTSCDLMLEDFQDVTRFYTFPVGTFYLMVNHRRVVDTVYIERKMSVEQVVREYGLSKVSQTVKTAWDNSHYQKSVDIVIGIEPREKSQRDLKKRDNLNMPFKSVHFENGADGKTTKLREGGFTEFPAICPRWEIFGEEVYASTCPGMDALGEIQGLQFNQNSKARVVDYQSNPPVQMPSSMKGSEDVLPGGVSYYDGQNPSGGIREAFQVNLQLPPLLEDIRDIRDSIDRHFFVDLFRMISNSSFGPQRTAREVAEVHEEKLLMLGPAMERSHNEVYKPIITRLFNQAMAAGILPPPPEELDGVELKVEFISTLAQAQKLVGLGSWDRMVQSAGVLGQIFGPSVMHKFKPDNMADSLSEMLGTDPDFIRSNDEVALIRQEEAKQQAAMAQAEQLQQGADTAKSLAQADTGGKNALTALTEGAGA